MEEALVAYGWKYGQKMWEGFKQLILLKAHWQCLGHESW
jgi:hypothetical protein